MLTHHKIRMRYHTSTYGCCHNKYQRLRRVGNRDHLLLYVTRLGFGLDSEFPLSKGELKDKAGVVISLR